MSANAMDGVCNVSEHKFSDFGQLYRAALAETDQDRKLLLLRRVGGVLEEWEQRTAGKDRPRDAYVGHPSTRGGREGSLQV
jgi:hypothetical protein